MRTRQIDIITTYTFIVSLGWLTFYFSFSRSTRNNSFCLWLTIIFWAKHNSQIFFIVVNLLYRSLLLKMGNLNSGLLNQIEGTEQWLLSDRVYEKKKSHALNFSIILAMNALAQNNSVWQLNLWPTVRLFKLHGKDVLLVFKYYFTSLTYHRCWNFGHP